MAENPTTTSENEQDTTSINPEHLEDRYFQAAPGVMFDSRYFDKDDVDRWTLNAEQLPNSPDVPGQS